MMFVRLIAGGFLLTQLTGCVGSGSLGTVDEDRKQLVLQSSHDYRTAMPDFRSEGEVSYSVRSLKQNVRRKPKRVKSILNLAQLYLVRNDLKKAEEYVRRALRADLKNTRARRVLAQIYLRRGNPDMAGIILNSLGGVASRDSEILNLLALVSLQEGRAAEAMARFRQGLKLNPSDVAIRMNLGVLFVKYRQMANAGVEFERVLKIMPDHNDARLHLAIIKASRGAYGEAEDIYGEILARSKDNPLALYNLAVLNTSMENYDDAIDSLNQYLDSPKARKSGNQEVYALIEEIKGRQHATGKRVSDEEIQSLARKMESSPARKKAPVARRATVEPEARGIPGVKNRKSAPRPASAAPARGEEASYDDEDIKFLEDQLK